MKNIFLLALKNFKKLAVTKSLVFSKPRRKAFVHHIPYTFLLDVISSGLA